MGVYTRSHLSLYIPNCLSTGPIDQNFITAHDDLKYQAETSMDDSNCELPDAMITKLEVLYDWLDTSKMEDCNPLKCLTLVHQYKKFSNQNRKKSTKVPYIRVDKSTKCIRRGHIFSKKYRCFGLYFVYKPTPFLLSNSRFKNYNIIL